MAAVVKTWIFPLKGLEESRDELQAAAALQAGRELLMLNPCNNTSAEKGPSLAVELLAGMHQDQVRSVLVSFIITVTFNLQVSFCIMILIYLGFIADGWPDSWRLWRTL